MIRDSIASMNFAFDIMDPRALAARLPELRSVLAAKVGEHDQLGAEIQELEDLIQVGEGLSRGGGRASVTAEPGRPRRRRASPAQDRAVQALERASTDLAGTAVGPTSLYKYMVERGVPAPKDATVLGTNLWDAWRAGRIRRSSAD
jgi:hypothetical protein